VQEKDIRPWEAPHEVARRKADGEYYYNPYSRDPKPPEKAEEVRPGEFEEDDEDDDDEWFYWWPIYIAIWFMLMSILSHH